MVIQGQRLNNLRFDVYNGIEPFDVDVGEPLHDKLDARFQRLLGEEAWLRLGVAACFLDVVYPRKNAQAAVIQDD